MTKQNFIALADQIRQRPDVFNPETINALADYCASQNPRFNRERWLGYIAGDNGPNGGPKK